MGMYQRKVTIQRNVYRLQSLPVHLYLLFFGKEQYETYIKNICITCGQLTILPILPDQRLLERAGYRYICK